MNRIASSFMLLALPLLPAVAGAYTFTSFQYPGATGTVFTGVDDTNRIVGYANTASSSQGIFLTAAGSLATITPNGYTYALPKAINRLGGVVGTAFNGSAYSMFQDNVNGFGPITDMLINQDVTGINSSFDYVGNFTSPSTENAVYLFAKGNYYTLLPGRCMYTHDPAINDSVVVAGNCVNQQNLPLVFTWTKGVFTFYSVPSNMTYVQATGINNAGEIAGWYIDPSGFDHGFTLNAGTFTTVDVPTAGVTNTQIWGINKAGKLVGSYNNGTVLTAFVATP